MHIFFFFSPFPLNFFNFYLFSNPRQLLSNYYSFQPRHIFLSFFVYITLTHYLSIGNITNLFICFSFAFFLYSFFQILCDSMPSNSLKSRKSKGQLSSHQNPNSLPKMKPMVAVSDHPHYLVIDTTLPSHIFNDRSLFTTYTPSRRLHQTCFGTDIVIEGTGDVHVRVVVKGMSILFCFQNSWHVQSSSYYLLSCSTITSCGHQVMVAGCSPRMIFSHKRRLVEPRLLKYMPFTQVDGLTVLRFQIPVQESVSSLPLSTAT